MSRSHPVLTLEDHFAGEYSCFERKPLIPFLNFEIPPSSKQAVPDQPVKKSRIKWTASEDEILLKHFDPKLQNWGEVASLLSTKTIHQIKKRWINKHDPSFHHRNWTKSEDRLILSLYNKYGGKWRKIA
jgi:hypothetical protein